MTAPPVILINLDRDADRLAHMAGELGRVGLAFERLPAVLGLAMADWQKPYFLNEAGAVASRLKPGEIGCYASHLLAARRIVDGALPAALVLEDDCALPGDLADLLAALTDNLPADWDIVRLSNPPKSPWQSLAPMPGGRDLVRYSRVPNNTGAQLLSRRGAAKLLAAGLRSLPIDEHLRRPWLLGLATYGVVPAPIRSNIFQSTIDALGDRGLSRESRLAKLARRHIGGPAQWRAEFAWQRAHLGAAGYAEALARSLAASAMRKIGANEAAARLLRMRAP